MPHASRYPSQLRLAIETICRTSTMPPQRKVPSSAAKKSKRKLSRDKSSEDFAVQELFPDDMAYDADVEIVQPDEYEEPESESEARWTPVRQLRSTDDELATRMRGLCRDSPACGIATPPSERGRKRTLEEVGDDPAAERRGRNSDFEISEVRSRDSSPLKKKNKWNKYPAVKGHLRLLSGTSTESSMGVPGRRLASPESSSSSSMKSVLHADDEDRMDMS